MLTLLDWAAGLERKKLEEASDPLCGGVLAEKGGACVTLWGMAMAAGVRAAARIPDRERAIGVTLMATRTAMSAYAAIVRQPN